MNWIRKLLRLLKKEKCFFLTLAVMLMITGVFKLCFSLNYIPSESMENTLQIGDVILSANYEKKQIERYDVITFYPPDDENMLYIKRVIGLPGDVIELRDGKVILNGVTIDEPYLKEEMNRMETFYFEVPMDSYFVMGDNRNESYDSRYWNEHYLPKENVVAKTKMVLYSPSLKRIFISLKTYQ